MIKEQWQEEKKNTPLSALAFFEYYREMGGQVENIADFISQLYSKFLVDGLDHLMPDGKVVSATRAEEKVREYYEEKFKYE